MRRGVEADIDLAAVSAQQPEVVVVPDLVDLASRGSYIKFNIYIIILLLYSKLNLCLLNYIYISFS